MIVLKVCVNVLVLYVTLWCTLPSEIFYSVFRTPYVLANVKHNSLLIEKL